MFGPVMTMRLPLLAALLCAAVGASAAVYVEKIFKVIHDDSGVATVAMSTTSDGKVLLMAGGYPNRFDRATLTKEEAASLGRALLEAAGQPEKKCEVCASGCIHLNQNPIDPGILPYVTTECSPTKCPGANLYGGTLQLDLNNTACGPGKHTVPCPEGRSGCLVIHCEDDK